MTQWLKHGDATLIQMGPFLDETDGKTPETGLTIALTDVWISKNGAIAAQIDAGGNAPTHDRDGYYRVELQSADLDTAGQLDVMIRVAGALPVWKTLMIVTPAQYDGLILGTGAVNANVQNWNGDGVQSLTVSGMVKVDVEEWQETAVESPRTAGIPIVDVELWDGDAVAVTASGLPKVDVEEWNQTLVSASDGFPAVNTMLIDGQAPSDAIVGAVWDNAMAELAAVPGVTDSFRDAFQWLFLLSRNKLLQSATQQTLRNDADSADIATAAISDAGGTVTRGEFV